MAETARKIDSDAQSVGAFLRAPYFYQVPFYQRDFAWTSEEIDTLWEDITNALEEDRKEYFLGAIVISRGNDDKKRDIVDGQQRLAVLSMIFSVISKIWRSRDDDKREHGVFRDYLGSEDRRTGDVISKLTLNETNDPLFQKIVLRGEECPPAEKKNLAHSNKLLHDALIRIDQKVNAWLSKFTDTDSALIDLEEFIANRSNLIVIEAGDESDAFIIFETLNDRGLELAVSDLVKNYLFSLGDGYIERFKKDWGK
ncbi:MAG: DUF262 domain-containing protein [Thermoproteota archaeon]|nr:DUF262 domain-containing protein [Thermoproteota archaeon]